MLCFGSLEMLQERSEPLQGCVGSLKTQRKWGLGGRGRGLALGELLLPITPLVASLMGILEFSRGKQRCNPEREERHGCAPDLLWVLILKVLPCFLKVEILGEVLGEDLHRIFISFMLMCQIEIYSPNFICVWVWLAQMVLIGFPLLISLSRVL